MMARELYPLPKDRSEGPSHTSLALINDFFARFRQNARTLNVNELGKEINELEGKIMYVWIVPSELHREQVDTPLGMQERVLLTPLRNILARHGYSEEYLQPNSSLEQGSLAAAREWLIEHPGSSSAKLIARLGLSALVGTHLEFLNEMLEEA